MSSFLISWLDPLIWRGYQRELRQEDLYVLPKEVESQSLLKQFNRLEVRAWLFFFKMQQCYVSN